MDSDFVSAVGYARVRSATPEEFLALLPKALAMPLDQRIAQSEKYRALLEDVFSSETVWEERDLLVESVVNVGFDTLLGEEDRLGYTLQQCIDRYVGRLLPLEELHVIDRIRKTLACDPRVIAISEDGATFFILDGWHTAIAFAVEGQRVPAYVGRKDSFAIYRRD